MDFGLGEMDQGGFSQKVLKENYTFSANWKSCFFHTKLETPNIRLGKTGCDLLYKGEIMQ